MSDNQEILNISELYGYDENDLTFSAYSICYHDIYKSQKTDAKLKQKLVSHKDNTLDTFREGDQNHRLIFQNSKMCLPTALQKKTVDWYHEMLCQPVETCTEHTISQRFDWKGLHKTVNNVCRKFPAFQRSKTTNQKYGNLPPKQAEINPWDTLCVDLIGPYTIPWKGKKTLILWCLTIINPATGWFEVAQIPNKKASEIADITKKTWFNRYPLPQKIVFDRGTKFMAKFDKMCQHDNDPKKKPITTRNPQSNSRIKQINQNIGNIISIIDVSNIVKNNPWSGILSANMFAVRATYHIKLQASPTQIVFGQDAILNMKHVTDWEHIWQHKQERIIFNNKRKNMRRNNHQYKVGDKILFKHKKHSKHKI